MPKRKADLEAAISDGVGMVAAGFSERDAAKAVGIPKSSMHNYCVRILGPGKPNREAAAKEAEQRLEASAFALAMGTVGRMADEYETAEPALLASWATASSRVLGRLRGWDTKQQRESDTSPRWVSAVSQLVQDGAKVTVTLERSDPQHTQVLDITHESE